MSDYIKIDALFDPYRKEWGLIFKGLIFNAIVSLSLLGALAILGKFEGIEKFNADGLITKAFFNPLSLSNFWLFFQRHCAMAPIAEEVFWRFPVFVFVAWNLDNLFRNQKLAKCALWLSLIIPTWFWASAHVPLILPVFISGLTYGWLIIKTRPSWPWPAIVCHSLSNLSLYILVKILQVFGYAPIN